MIQLDPKTLTRIRDHLLDLGAPPSTKFLTAGEGDADPFGGDPEPESRFGALFETMYLMVVADGDVAAAERDVLRGAMRTLTANSIRTAQIDAMFDTCKEKLDGASIAGRIADIAPILKNDKVLLEAAFSLAAAIAFADEDIHDAENDLINDLAEAFDIDSERADELLNEISEGGG
jgi:uncharacterized tellurite resistance protein B-like protein